MSYQSLDYVLFLAAVVLLHRLVAARRTARVALLTAASYAFYALGSGLWVALLVALTAWDHLLARAIDRSEGRRRGLLLAASVAADLGVLALFKYAAFLTASADRLVAWIDPSWGVSVWSPGSPWGLSFYVFSSLTCTIDVYRRRARPAESLLEYAAFVSFFPKILAGPIARAGQFLPQLGTPPSLGEESGSRGLFLLLVGLFKKIAIADFLGRNLADRIFDAPGRYSSVEVLAGIYGYTLQIYYDFSGLSDMAVGAALLLGLRLPMNFDLPYRSTSLQEFWRRWHLSLSFWLRDYLYVPLGGNRRGVVRTYANLFATMLLGGLWHGAGWTFVAWGALHGGGLAVERAVVGWWRRRPRLGEMVPAVRFAGRLLAGLLVFHFAAFCWVFFRAPDFGSAWAVLHRLGDGSTHAPNLDLAMSALLFGAAALHFLPRALFRLARDLFVRVPAPVQAAILLLAALLLSRLAGTFTPFIYQQF